MRISFRLLLAPAAAAVLLGGCNLVEVVAEEGDDVLVVESVLRTDEARQKLLLHRSLRSQPEEPLAWVRADLIYPDGRERRLEPSPRRFCRADGDDGEIAQPLCFTYFAPSEDRILPGESYGLRLETSDGRLIFGRTHVPGELTMVSPSPTLWTERDRAATCWLEPWTLLQLRWGSAAGAWSYIAELEVHGLGAALGEDAPEGLAEPLRLTGLAIGASDTTMVLPADFALFQWGSVPLEVLLLLQRGFPDGVQARLVLSAADRNYVNAVRGGGFNPSGAVRTPSVVGDGTGVFGSLVARSLVIDVAEQAIGPPCAG
jgi:hypothetical protein